MHVHSQQNLSSGSDMEMKTYSQGNGGDRGVGKGRNVLEKQIIIIHPQ